MKYSENREDFEKEFGKVWRYSKRKHDDTKAKRKSSQLPYFVHPENTAKIAEKYGGTETEVKAAMLHDTVEDAGAVLSDIEEKFGRDVMDIVEEITNDRDIIDKIGKENYINHELISISHPALFVKLCDMLQNSSDAPTESQARRMKNNIDYLLANRNDLDDREKSLVDSINAVLYKVVA